MAGEWIGMDRHRLSNKLRCLITEEQAQFLEEYVSSISGDECDFWQINYKKDFILTEEMEEMLNVLNDKFSKFSMNFWDEVDEEELPYYVDDDEFIPNWVNRLTNDRSYSLDDVTIIKDGELFYVELEVFCEVS